MMCGGCTVYEPGIPFRAGADCRLCWLYANRDDYRAHWDGAPPLDKKPKLDTSCIHRGEVLRLVECETCSGKRKLKVYSCKIWEACHLADPKKLPHIRSCILCEDRVSDTIPNQKGAE